jgi:hypothetical protein
MNNTCLEESKDVEEHQNQQQQNNGEGELTGGAGVVAARLGQLLLDLFQILLLLLFELFKLLLLLGHLKNGVMLNNMVEYFIIIVYLTLKN